MSNDLTDIAREAIALLRPIVESARFPARSTPVSAYSSAFRPYLEAALTGIPPRPVISDTDRRKRPWRLSMEFWKIEGYTETCAASSPGRITDTRGEVLELGGDVVAGLDAAAELIADYASQCGANVPDFSIPAIARALQDLRSTLSRQQGKATMRRTSACGKWHLVCDVQREESL